MLVYLNRAFARAPIGALNLRPLIVLSIITYLFAIVCIGQLRQERHHGHMGAPGVDASPIMSGDLEERDGDGDEDEDSLAAAAPSDKMTTHLVKRSEVQAPVNAGNKVRSFAESPAAAASNSIGVGGSRPFDNDQDDDDDDQDDDDDEDDDDRDDDERGERNTAQGKGQESTGGASGQTQVNQPAPSLINRIMHFGGFGRAGGNGGAGGEQKNSQESGNGARLFKLGLILGR